MTRTEELLKLVDALEKAKGQMQIGDASYDFRKAANPKTIKQLVELCRLQHEAITKCTEWGLHYGRHCEQPMEEAIAAFNKFEGGV